MKYAHMKEDSNRLIGWYDDTIHTIIPKPNIKVSDEVWQEALEDGANAYVDGAFAFFDFRTQEGKKVQKQTRANAKLKKYLNDTDWYIIRLQEAGTAVPKEILDARVVARESVT